MLTARLSKRNDETPKVGDEATASGIVADLDDANYIVKSVSTREKRRNPVPPFITSTLQQEASRKLRFSVKRTMMLAQGLYEGKEMGKEGVGRPHHLHAYGFHACFRRCPHRSPDHGGRALWREYLPGTAKYI